MQLERKDQANQRYVPHFERLMYTHSGLGVLYKVQTLGTIHVVISTPVVGIDKGETIS